MRRNYLRLLAGGLALLGCSQAQAQNLVTNTGFATNLSGWLDFGSAAPADGTRTWNADDVDAIPSSGSAQFTVQQAGSQIGLTQCVPVTAGQTYSYYARVKFLAGQTTGLSRAMMEVAFFPNVECSASPDGAQGQGAVIGTAYPLSDTVWGGIPGNAAPGSGFVGSATAPAGTSSAQVRIFVEQLSGSDVHSARFDQVVFHNASGVPVSLMQFDVE